MTTWSVIDDRQIIKAEKVNPKIYVCKINNKLQKAGVMFWQSTVHRRLWHKITHATQQDANLWPAPKNRKAKLEFAKKHKGEPVEFLNCVLWTDETQINLYLTDGKAKVWRKKGTANDPKHTTSSVKHGGGAIMVWTCMAVSGTDPLNVNDDLMYNPNSGNVGRFF